MSLIECIPNVSEGRNSTVIEELATVIRQQPSARLLHVDPGQDANRTVLTFVVSEEQALPAAISFIKAALQRIDMRTHKGEHERNGAVDVFPFVPLHDATMATCIDLAEKLAEIVGRELGIPVYLYGRAARKPGRENLSALRRGQYESLERRLSDPIWQPDAGPSDWSETVARAGSIQIGARPFLIAWNINLETRDARIARRIAARIRTSGDGAGRPGLFAELKARGWYMAHYDCAQVTMNLTDFRITPLHRVFNATCELALEYGTRVTGSELVGLIPREALIDSGRMIEGATAPDEKHLMNAAIESLGLSQLAPFIAEERVLEYCLDR